MRAFARQQPRTVAETVDEAVRQQLRRDTGDGALSNGRKLGRATTRVTVRDDSSEVVADGSRAVWGIIEGGTTGHVIEAPRGKLLRTPHGPRRRVRVAGVRARRTFSDAAQRGLDDAQRQLESDWAQL